MWGTVLVSSSNETLIREIATYVFSHMCPGKWTGSRDRKSCGGSLRKGCLWASACWEGLSWILCDMKKRWPACPDVLSQEELGVWETLKGVTQTGGQESQVNGQIGGPSGISCSRVCSLVWGKIRCSVERDPKPGSSETCGNKSGLLLGASFVCILVLRTWAQALTHSRQVLYHWDMPLAWS